MSPLEIANRWLAAFNAHDVSALVALYAIDATHTSPKIRALHPETGGHLIGHEALSRWWSEALARTPSLRYEPTALTADASRVFMEYLRHAHGEAPLPVAEVLCVSDGLITASRVYHG